MESREGATGMPGMYGILGHCFAGIVGQRIRVLEE